MTAPQLARAKTGIEGLDDVLGGGLPAGRLYLLQGDPGVGKTTVALSFLREAARAKERCLYITLSETEEELHAVADSHSRTGPHDRAIRLFEVCRNGFRVTRSSSSFSSMHR